MISLPSVDYQQYIDAIDEWIAGRPQAVVLAFLLVTAAFAVGLGRGGTETGTGQFTEDVPAQEAFEEVNANFERTTFGGDTGTTQLIQRGGNVLAKPALLRMLRAQERLHDHEDLRVTGSRSVARAAARELDPSADTIADEIDAVEAASPAALGRAIRRVVARRADLRALVSTDYSARSVTASTTIGTVTHSLSATADDGGGGGGGSDPLEPIQVRARHVVASVGGDITVFGSGISSREFSRVISDSLRIVVPAATLLILLFLIVAYRDPVDLLLGVVSLGMAIVWTFGFMGLAGIAFTQLLIAVPPLLLAVGIDFGIHTINRYREERVGGEGIAESMRITTDQLLVAFFIVTGTTVLGFAANLSSQLGTIREFGLVASVGIVFTFLIFGVFLPAAKVLADRARERIGIPAFGSRPLGAEDSLLGRVLPVGVAIARYAPRLFLVGLLLSTAVAAGYGAGVESEFSRDDFLPPEETPAYFEYFPEQVQPSEYTVTGTTNLLEDRFETGEEETTTVYVEGSLRQDYALEALSRAGESPPSSFVVDDGHARETSIVTVIRARAERDPEFAALVDRNDLNDNGVPDRNLPAVYAALLDSPARDRALAYITDDYTRARIRYQVEADASQDAVTADTREVADRMRFEATATGGTVVFKAISDLIGRSAFVSLALALLAAGIFLLLVYAVLEGRPSLGVVNLVPIVVTIVAIAATMRALGIAFNALTGTTLSIGLGLGIDYSAHVVHRFADEYDRAGVHDALLAAVRGTGGALTGSMLTTVTGIGVLVLAITPILGQFGLLTALSILYSYLAALLVLPATLVVWDQYWRWRASGPGLRARTTARA